MACSAETWSCIRAARQWVCGWGGGGDEGGQGPEGPPRGRESCLKKAGCLQEAKGGMRWPAVLILRPALGLQREKREEGSYGDTCGQIGGL